MSDDCHLQGDLHQPNPGNVMLEQLVEQARPWAQAQQQMDSPSHGSSQQVIEDLMSEPYIIIGCRRKRSATVHIALLQMTEDK